MVCVLRVCCWCTTCAHSVGVLRVLMRCVFAQGACADRLRVCRVLRVPIGACRAHRVSVLFVLRVL